MRISGEPPRLVGKDFWGEPGSPQWKQAEQVKAELQRFLRSLAEASDQAQVDLDGLLESSSSTNSNATLHAFLLMGA